MSRGSIVLVRTQEIKHQDILSIPKLNLMEQTRSKGTSRCEDLVCVAQETAIASRFTADPLSLIRQ